MSKRRTASQKQNRSTQAGLLIAAATIPNTFQETLMPRSTSDQGIVTGFNMAANYEIANAIVKVIEDMAQDLSGTRNAAADDYSAQVRQRRFSLVLSLLAIGGSESIQRKYKQTKDETPVKGIARTGAGWVSRAAFANVIVASLQSLLETTDTSKKRRVISRVPVGLIGGFFTAIYTDQQRRSAIKKSNGQKLHDNHANSVEALGMGIGILGILGAVGYGQRAFGDVIAD